MSLLLPLTKKNVFLKDLFSSFAIHNTAFYDIQLLIDFNKMIVEK